MFVTRTHGYWHSTDLQNWNFINPGENWYPQGCNAPAAHNYKDSVLYVCGDPSGVMSVLYTDNPKSGNWKATPAIITNLQDPDLFLDDDGSAYIVSYKKARSWNFSISTQRNMVGNVLEKIMPIPCWAAISKDRG